MQLSWLTKEDNWLVLGDFSEVLNVCEKSIVRG